MAIFSSYVKLPEGNNKLLQDPWHFGPFSNPRISKVWGLPIWSLTWAPPKKIGSHPIIPRVPTCNCSKAGKSQKLKDLCGLALGLLLGCWGASTNPLISNGVQNPSSSDHFRFSGRFLWAWNQPTAHEGVRSLATQKKYGKCHLDNP